MTDPRVPREVSQLIERVARGDRSTSLALHAILSAADDQGLAVVDEVVVIYRDDHLADLRDAGKDAEREAGRLSLDEVRLNLTTVLARLAGDGIVNLMGDPATPEARVQVSESLWREIRPSRSEVADIIRHTGEHRALRPTPGRASGAVAGRAAPSGSVLEASGLTKEYRGRKVVNDVALRLQQGEIVGLLGPNGAGKTTTFYMIVGLIPPLAGRITLDGENVTSMPMYRRARRGIGYLSQEPSIFRKLTVEENILAILETLPLSKAERRQRLEQLLGELRIEPLRKSKAFQLSGGERRRLEITRALVTQPKFMMLDEPFAGVDPIAVHDIQSIVASLRERRIGVLISDHNVEQTLDIVDRAYIMYEGRVGVSGTVSELVWNDEVAEIYLGPTLTARMRQRYPNPA